MAGRCYRPRNMAGRRSKHSGWHLSPKSATVREPHGDAAMQLSVFPESRQVVDLYEAGRGRPGSACGVGGISKSAPGDLSAVCPQSYPQARRGMKSPLKSAACLVLVNRNLENGDKQRFGGAGTRRATWGEVSTKGLTYPQNASRPMDLPGLLHCS